MSDATANATLAAGYLLAVPFTVYVPGFRRLWKRREPAVFVTAQVGAALITTGWLLKGRTSSAVVNGSWLVGLSVAYALAGRRRDRV